MLNNHFQILPRQTITAQFKTITAQCQLFQHPMLLRMELGHPVHLTNGLIDVYVQGYTRLALGPRLIQKMEHGWESIPPHCFAILADEIIRSGAFYTPFNLRKVFII